MNKSRRAKILKLIDDLDAISTIASDILDEETESFDNLPEGIAESDMGSRMEASIDCLENALDSISDAVDNLNDAVS